MKYYHFAELIFHQARKYGNRTALKTRNEITNKWEKISWKEFADQVLFTAKALAEFGVKEQDNIGICSQNMAEYFYTDFGAYSNRVAPISIYATSSQSQIDYIVTDAHIETLFVGEQTQYNNAYKVQKENPVLKRLVIYDSAVKLYPDDKTSLFFKDFQRYGDNMDAEAIVRARIKRASPNDRATIIYTSGTTGEPKGVLLSHKSFLAAIKAHCNQFKEVTDHDSTMTFLPLSHVFEKAWSYVCLSIGVSLFINKNPREIQKTLPEVRPTLMCNVPRFWEKVYQGVQDKINSSSPSQQKILRHALEVGHKYFFDYKNKGLKVPLSLKLSFEFYNKTLFFAVKKRVGLDRGRLFPVGGAPLSAEVCEFLMSMDFPIVVGYGMTETLATVSFFPKKHIVMGSIGEVMEGMNLKIDPETNEILVKGDCITSGYYNKPEATKAAFTEDGFFRTGDAGRFEGKTLFFKERIKDLYKTSNGKYIAPQVIESLIGLDSYIDQVAVIGNERKFVSALIVPDFCKLEKYADKEGIVYASHEELVSNKQVRRFIESRIEEHQKKLASFEKIKKIVLLSEPFTIANGQLTDTMKIKRKVVSSLYKDKIDLLYVN